MQRKFPVLAVLFAALTISAFGHGGAEHVKGTITKVDDTSVTLTTPDKETKVIHFDKTTKFLKSGAESTSKELKVGDRVVVDVHQMEGKVHASQVRFGAQKKATTDHGNHGADHKKHEEKKQ